MAFCECGCGQETALAIETDISKGWVKGVPLRFIRFHVRRAYRKYGPHTDSSEYKAWWSTLSRCEDPTNPQYRNYGGRGISVVGKMREFLGFMEVMGTKPSADLSIDRINNDGNYEEGNVRWATRRQQGINRRKQKLSFADAQEIRRLSNFKGVKELAEIFNVSRRHIHHIKEGRYLNGDPTASYGPKVIQPISSHR